MKNKSNRIGSVLFSVCSKKSNIRKCFMLFSQGSKKKGQHEMVGFVLIVVLVVIGLFAFLLFSLKPGAVLQNDIANNMLTTIMKTSSSCALVYEENPDDMRDLFKSCLENRRCSNTEEMACDVLNDTLNSILDEMLVLEPIIDAYELEYLYSTPMGDERMLHLLEGNCNGTVYGSEPQPIRVSGDENLIVILRICLASDI